MSLRDLLDSLPIPIIQAPMAGASSPEMALAVSRAGGLGSVAAAAFSPEEIEAQAAAFRAGADAPFNINLLIAPPLRPEPAELDAALARLAPWYEALGIPTPEAPNRFSHDFQAQLAAVVRAAPPIASFAFDVLDRTQVAELQAAGSYVVGTANTVAEARAWAAAGADGIVAQGFEAGGHRGNFLDEIDASLVGTMALTATILAAVELPVIAAGGIMDGRGVAAALALGASAAQMGTAFLRAEGTIVPATGLRALGEARDDPTRLTRAFSGRYARGLENRFMREMRAVETEVPAYPVQNRLTGPLREAAARAGDAEMMSVWAGQAVRLATTGNPGEMVEQWWAEAGEAARVLRARTGGGVE